MPRQQTRRRSPGSRANAQVVKSAVTATNKLVKKITPVVKPAVKATKQVMKQAVKQVGRGMGSALGAYNTGVNNVSKKVLNTLPQIKIKPERRSPRRMIQNGKR